jgi:hypothetical protein
MSDIAEKLVSLEDVLEGERPWESKGLSDFTARTIRRHYIDLLRIEGKCPFEISRLLGIPDTTVRRDIKSLENEEKKVQLAKIRDQKRTEIDKQYQRVIGKTEEHRKKALKPVLEKTIKTTKKGDKDKAKSIKELSARINEANAALKIQLDTINSRAKLWGLDVNVHELTTPEGGTNLTVLVTSEEAKELKGIGRSG